MNQAVVTLHGVNKSFGTGAVRTQVLHNIDLELRSGEMTFIVGPSGCGKTTLISIIGGILNADDGEVNVLDNLLTRQDDRQKTLFRQRNLGFIFQQFNLIPTLTAEENVSIPLLIERQSHRAARQKARELLEQVGLGDRCNYYPRQLSGGQQQRVSIARALVTDPKLLICDEPTASLDGPTGHGVMETLKDIADDPNRAVIVVTHDNRIFHFGDRQVSMEDGRIKSVERMDVSPSSDWEGAD